MTVAVEQQHCLCAIVIVYLVVAWKKVVSYVVKSSRRLFISIYLLGCLVDVKLLAWSARREASHELH